MKRKQEGYVLKYNINNHYQKDNINNRTAYSYSRYYGGQFHLTFPGIKKNRNILALDGAYGQSILIDIKGRIAEFFEKIIEI